MSTPEQAKRKKRKRKKPRLTKQARQERRSLLRFLLAFVGILVLGIGISVVLIQVRSRSVGNVIDYQRFVQSDVNTNLAFVQALTPAAVTSAMRIGIYRENQMSDHCLITIPPGTSVPTICTWLEDAGVIGSQKAEALAIYLVQQGIDREIKAGIYLFPQNIDLETAALILIKGFSDWAVFSFSDGMTIDQIDAYLHMRGITSRGDFIAAADKVVSECDGSFAEGYFYPETYVVSVDKTAASLLARAMYDTCLTEISPYYEAIEQQGHTIDEVMIIASMIQRETADPDDMPLISGIIWNRVATHMPLGIDATTRYETGNWDRPITTSELQADTPYNTRKRPGIPPTGISNPGPAAIEAAVYPEKTEYFYYLHDRSGLIHPAITYAEHLEHVKRYLR